MKTIIIAFTFLINFSAFGQATQYDLSTLLKKTQSNYPVIKAKQALINAANYNLQAARKDYLPDFIVADQYQYATANGLEGSYYSNGGTAISTSGGVHSQNIYEPVFGSFTTLMVNWHAFDFGKVKESFRLAQSRVDLAKADYNNAVFQQQIRVADAYLLYVLSEKLVTVQENNLKRAQVFQQYVISHTSSGLLPGVDSSSSNAEVAKAQLALLQSEQFVEEQKNNLEQLSGVSADSIRIDTTSFLQRIPFIGSLNVSIDNNPIMDYQRQLLTTEHNQLNVLKKSALPTINILGMTWARGSGVDRITKSYNPGLMDGIPYQAYNYMAGVAVNWNITLLVKNRQQYLSATQQIESSRFQMEEEISILNKEIKNAQLQYESAIQQTKVAPVQYKAALDAYNLSTARYQAGLASLNDVVQAYYVLNRADVDKAIAVNNVWRAILQHAAASGIFSEFTNQLPQ